MITVTQMRDKISKVYDNFKWVDRVAHMKDNQVIAIYYRMKEDGVFTKKKSKKKNMEDYMQLTIYDCFPFAKEDMK